LDGIVGDRAGIDHIDIGGVMKRYAVIPMGIELPPDRRGFGKVELAAQGIEAYLLHSLPKIAIYGSRLQAAV
jgi:hypothetical protein